MSRQIYLLGDVEFQIASVNLHETSTVVGSRAVRHEVLGGEPPVEFIGPDSVDVTLKGMLFPSYNSGELEGLNRLQEMARDGQDHYLVRGDGDTLGYFLVENVRETSTELDTDGVGRIIKFEMSLVRSDTAETGRLS